MTDSEMRGPSNSEIGVGGPEPRNGRELRSGASSCSSPVLRRNRSARVAGASCFSSSSSLNSMFTSSESSAFGVGSSFTLLSSGAIGEVLGEGAKIGASSTRFGFSCGRCSAVRLANRTISCRGVVARKCGTLRSMRFDSSNAFSRLYLASDSAKSSSSRSRSSSESCKTSGPDDVADTSAFSGTIGASVMDTLEKRRVSIGAGLGEVPLR